MITFDNSVPTNICKLEIVAPQKCIDPWLTAFRIGFDPYGHTDTNTDMPFSDHTDTDISFWIHIKPIHIISLNL